MNNILKLGLILAAIGIIANIVYKYILGYEILFGPGKYITMVISIIVLVVLGRKFFRDPEDGTLGYGEAVKKLFLSLLIGSSISLLGSVLLFGNDQEMNDAYLNYNIEVGESTARTLGGLAGQSEAEIETGIEEMKELYRSDDSPLPKSPFSFNMLPLNILSAAVTGIIGALIIAIFIKKKDGSITA